MDRSEFYRDALTNLGAVSTAKRALSLRLGRGPYLKLTSKYLKNPVYCRRESTDLTVFDQIFVEREYRCLDGIREADTIVDAGANCGYSSAYFLSRYPTSRVVSIEPDPANFAMLTMNVAPYGSRAQCLEAALWSHPARLRFKSATTGTGNEWGRQTTETGEATQDAEIAALDMPAIIQRFGLGQIDILKIDIEGAEAQVFSAPDLSWLDNVRNIVIELHGDDCEAAFRQAIDKYGFAQSRCGELMVCLSPDR